MGIKNLFKRGSKLAESKVNKAIDKAQENDPVATVTQVIRDLDEKKKNAVEKQGKVKAAELLLAKEVDELNDKISEWTNKAKALYGRMNSDNESTIKPLVTEALNKRENLQEQVKKTEKKLESQKILTEKISKTIKEFSDMIEEAKEQLDDLRTRSEVAEANKEIQEELGDTSSLDSAKSILKRMERKVTETEATADAMSQLNDEDKSLEDRIADAMGTPSTTADDKLFAEFENELK